MIQILGSGRAARAQLVEATFADGRSITCVEKVFDPGLLTRTIYRLSFQSPFGYQKNRHAIMASFYRRRVAGAILAASDVAVAGDTCNPPNVAQPLYVRFDQETKSWVLAAQWIQGRGIKPAPPDPTRVGRWWRWGNRRSQITAPEKRFEIDEIVDVMRKSEQLFQECGLVGSGWQVSPRAMVSTANLLRVGDNYTIIDLESGIPAVLVPSYLLSGLRQGQLPPFDDLNATQLLNWLDEQATLIKFRIGIEATEQLFSDTAKLIEHSDAWKKSEVAFFRRPWTWLTADRWRRYRAECLRRWQQDGTTDTETATKLTKSRTAKTLVQTSLIWTLSALPSSLGRYLGRLVGRSDTREHTLRWLRDRDFRQRSRKDFLEKCRARWIHDGRISPQRKPGLIAAVGHRVLERLTSAKIHRLVTDGSKRREIAKVCLLLCFSRRYQSWLGHRRIEAAITRWQDAQRISADHAKNLRSDLSGEEVRVYTCGFGMHLALKAVAPVVLPAKVGGFAAFIATGNLLFLLPFVITPVIRHALTWASVWRNRKHQIPHAEALMISLIPTFGSSAFLLQMFASRPRLATFLLRDVASSVGRRIPIYGGADSRTEIALIRAADYCIEAMKLITSVLQRIRRRLWRAPAKAVDSTPAEIIPISRLTGWKLWLDRQAIGQIERHELSAKVVTNVPAAEDRKSA